MSEINKYWLVSVAAGLLQMKSIQVAKAAGISVFALDEDPNSPGFKIADDHKVVDIKDPDAVVSAVKEKGIIPQGAISFVSDVGMLAAAYLREIFDLPGPNISQSKALTNKVIQRSIWQDHDIPGPQWMEAYSLQDAIENVERIGLPVIVKPIDSCGSRGVCKIESHTNLEDVLKTAFCFSQTGSVIIESFIDGQEYSVETFSENGRAHILTISKRTLIHDTTASEIFTADLTESQYETIATTIQQAFDAIGYTDGPGHTEIMLCSNGQPKLIETAGRGGGFQIFDTMVYEVSGYDIVTATIFQAVGREITQLPKVFQKKYAILHYIPSYQGYIKKISGFELANNLEGVEAVPLVSIGEKVRNVQCDGDRLGYILTVAETISEARLLNSQALNLIDFEMDSI